MVSSITILRVCLVAFAIFMVEAWECAKKFEDNLAYCDKEAIGQHLQKRPKQSDCSLRFTNDLIIFEAVRLYCGQPHSACASVLGLLLDAGADPNALNIEGQPVLHFMIKKCQQQPYPDENLENGLSMLMEHDADPTQLSRSSETGFEYAEKMGVSSRAHDILEGRKIDEGDSDDPYAGYSGGTSSSVDALTSTGAVIGDALFGLALLYCCYRRYCRNQQQKLMLDEEEGGDNEVPLLPSSARTPPYWENQDLSQDFDERCDVPAKVQIVLQHLLETTFKSKATRDRGGPMPSRLQMIQCQRIEDRRMWAQYLQEKQNIQEKRGYCAPVESLEGTSGQVKTWAAASAFQERLSHDLNEYYLWHGTSPTGAMGITEDGFKIDMAGSNAGTMFGKGAYFAECCSKSDEYAKDDGTGIYKGIYALLLCRVVCGELFRVEKSDIPAIEDAMRSGDYDSVLGDREAKVGTYREFVVFRERQIYPEYLVLYRREFDVEDEDSE
eukprot:gnl/MRDRNA2_/MRDRNA2_92853_c0_seq1.p1 gnl/MRDRNA2_/MRDRNA2_92853_c0~~gnl/MRDRNA2_/MRDRNA2_92853_c0_seq1.p1  ORF type:complete len:497 (-),score=68.63 gnl/MRDRNA2_/MRDRNA2_92853_c0_seq1:435-1925(-)